METKSTDTYADVWLFLGGGGLLAAGYLGWENLLLIRAALYTLQADVAGGAGWLASNWGLIALIAAMIVAGVKWALQPRSDVVGADNGPAIAYKKFKHVRVNLVR